MKRLVENSCVKLQGFNNLTKTLNFNLYDFCVARTASERESYVDYVNKNFDSKRISQILIDIAQIIEARVLAVSDQNYQPWGASSLVLLSDLSIVPTMQAMHLDKSHICAHTYPDFRGDGQVCSFRIDINISTCGEISPLRALDCMLTTIESDVVIIDYFVRGFTRDQDGKRIYLDHEISSIQDYIDNRTLGDYQCFDQWIAGANTWQTKMLRTKMSESSYFRDPVDLQTTENREALALVKKEMQEVINST